MSLKNDDMYDSYPNVKYALFIPTLVSQRVPASTRKIFGNTLRLTIYDEEIRDISQTADQLFTAS